MYIVDSWYVRGSCNFSLACILHKLLEKQLNCDWFCLLGIWWRTPHMPMITQMIQKDSLSGMFVLALRNETSLRMDRQSGPSSAGRRMIGSLPALEQMFSVFMRHQYAFIFVHLFFWQLIMMFYCLIFLNTFLYC